MVACGFNYVALKTGIGDEVFSLVFVPNQFENVNVYMQSC